MSIASGKSIAPKELHRRSDFFAELRQALTGLQRDETLSGFLFVIPNFLAFSLFSILVEFYIIFTQRGLAKPPEFVGWANFWGDRFFWKILANRASPNTFPILGEMGSRFTGNMNLVCRWMKGELNELLTG